MNKAIHVNSKEFTISNNQAEFKGTRFVNPNEKQKIKDLIHGELKNEFKKNKISDLYAEILGLSN
jgi:hypothetical protein